MTQQVAVNEPKALKKIDEKALSAELAGLQDDFQQETKIRAELIKIPTIRLTNSMSKSSKSRLAMDGDFCCMESSVVFGNEIWVVPFYFRETASLMTKAGKLMCRSEGLVKNIHGEACLKCPHDSYWDDWTKGPPACSKAINFYGVVNGNVYELIFRKTSYDAGKSLLNLLLNDKICTHKYLLKAQPDKRDSYEFFSINPVISKQALTMEELSAIVPKVKKVKDLIKARRIDTEEKPEEEFPL